MTNSKPLLGILGGTFDPVHFGHLRTALDVMQALDLEQVRFLPNSVPPHREQPWLDVTTRKQLLEIAVQDMPGFELDCRELDREGKSYMVDTLTSLRADFPGHHLCLILGMDAFAGLHQWHQWQRILEFCHIVVIARPGFDWPTAPELQALERHRTDDAGELKRAEAGRILLQSVTQLDISASNIRKQLQAGQDIRYLLPEAVRLKLLEKLNT
ncbi:MAG: nicotinate-nucleotide adenylyltransferase [Gammaproteobacteria bacterium]|jgi:nicotinate-nucleotide adenylyltransferase|nr:nicotinate-nucleotide adenylyltransferase [Gammaproteobacteria bacterium]